MRRPASSTCSQARTGSARALPDPRRRARAHAKRIHVHDVPVARAGRRPVREPVRLAAARVRQHRARVRRRGSGRGELGVARDERRRSGRRGRASSSCAADLDDAAVVEDDDLVGVAHGREPVRDRDRRPPLGEPVERLLDEPLGLGVERRSSPRRGRGSAGCAGSCARSRCAASRRRRSGSRARRRRCRSPRAARRSRGGCAPPRRRPRSPRRSRPASRSAGSRAPTRGRDRSPARRRRRGRTAP